MKHESQQRYLSQVLVFADKKVALAAHPNIGHCTYSSGMSRLESATVAQRCGSGCSVL